MAYTDNDPFPAETHERGLDRVTMIAQGSAGAVDRALRFPATDLATLNPDLPNSTARAGRYLAFDANGLPIASTGPTGASAIPVSSFIEGLLDDGDAETARATLGLSIGTDVAPAGIIGDFVGRVAAYVGITPPSGWLLLNADTIGNNLSDADHESTGYEDLFLLLWNSMGQSQAAVDPERGIDAATDWGNGKTLKLPDLRGRPIIGTGQGNSLTDRIHGGTNGAETHLLTANQSGVPDHLHGGWHGGASNQVAGDSDDGLFPRTGLLANTEGVVGGAKSAIEAHNNMLPFLALNYIVKF